jgi:hypothetical protein
MSACVNMELEVLEGATAGNIGPRMAGMLTSYRDGAESGILNARAVEFIAKPGRVTHLRNCMRREVAELLQRQAGFAGILVLNSHKEPRLIRVLSFWSTANQATDNQWEDTPAVHKLIANFIDVCAKVHCYEASAPESTVTSAATR